MTRYVGVRCKTCEKNIALAVMGAGTNEIAFYAVPLEPIHCERCGASHLYGPEDRTDFDGTDGLLPG